MSVITMLTTTTSKIKETLEKSHTQLTELFIPFNPTPASRPRVTRYGTYYGKTYTSWRKDVEAWFKCATRQTDKPLVCILEHFVSRPKTSKRSYPKGDVDNYAKGPLDALTKWWGGLKDDDQIVGLWVTKEFTEGDPGVRVILYEI